MQSNKERDLGLFTEICSPFMNRKFISWSIFIILCIIWGSSFKLMKDSTAGLDSIQIAALRIFSAGLIFLPFAFFHVGKISRKKIGLVVLSAVFGNLLPAFLFAEAMTKIDGSLGGILNSLTPICVVLIGTLAFRDKISSQKIWGVLTGFLGLVLLTLLPALGGEKNISFDNLGYTLLIFLATVLYGINVNMVSHYLKGINPIQLATVSLAAMTIPTGLILLWRHFFELNFADQVVRDSVLATIGLGVLGSAIATALFYVLVQRAGGLFASLVTYGIPFVALIWGVFDRENISLLKIICLAIILFGVYLANRPEKRTGESKDPSVEALLEN